MPKGTSLFRSPLMGWAAFRKGRIALALLLAMALGHQSAQAQSSINLGSAENFAVLAGSGITNTGATTIIGDVGTFPTPAITGFETVALVGTNHGADAVTQLAKTDLLTAYNDAAGRMPTTVFTPIFDLGGLTLAPGVYNDPSSFGITGTLTLDAQGDANAVWIFQTGTTLTTAAGSRIVLINGAGACNIFWQVGTSAVLGTGTEFAGSILASESISLGLGATVDGRILALNGAVTMNGNIIEVCEVVIDGDAVITVPVVVDAITLEQCSRLGLLSTLTITSGNLNVAAGQASITGGTVITPGDLNLNGAGTLVANTFLQVGGNANINQGGLLVNGVLEADQTIVAPEAFLGGAGLIASNVTNAGLLAPGNVSGCVVDPGSEIGTLSILGDYTQTPTGTFQMEIGSLLSYDSLIVSGAVTLSGTLQIIPLPGFSLAFGQQFQFLQADSISGAFDSIILPTGFRGRILQEGGFLTLLIAPESYTQAAQNPNQQQVAAALDSFITSDDDDEQAVSEALDLLTVDQYGDAFDAIGPAFYQTLGIIAIEQANAQNQFLAQRLSSSRLGSRGFQAIAMEAPLVNDRDGKSVIDAHGGKSVVDGKGAKGFVAHQAPDNIMSADPSNKWGVWVQGNGIFGKISNVNQVPNSRFQSGGFTTGIDYRWAEHFTTGIFGGYQGLYSKYTNGGMTTVNTALFGTYTTYQNGGFYSDLVLTGGYSGYNVRRPIQFGSIDRTASSRPDGGQFSAYLDLGYDWKVGQFTFGPIVSLQYTYAGIAPFTESGADSLDLQVDQQNINSLRSSLGGRVAYTWNITRNITLIPEVRMFWQHEYLENSRNIGASLNGGDGADFGYQTSNPDRDSVFAGAGVSAQFGDRWSAFCFYNADFGRQDYLAHMITVGAGWKF